LIRADQVIDQAMSENGGDALDELQKYFDTMQRKALRSTDFGDYSAQDVQKVGRVL